MRTLVISDLHLGNRGHRDVLRHPGPLAVLLDALEGIDRLVLLGDIAELVTRTPRRSLDAAEPVLRALGQRLGRAGEIVLVPGNHDAPLIREWARARGIELGLDDAVTADASLGLARVMGWLGPATVRVHYPGVWLEPEVYATHGHYLEHGLIPASAIGVSRGLFGLRRPPVRSPSELENGTRDRARRRRAVRGTGIVRRPLGALTQLARSSLIPVLPRLLLRARLTSITAVAVDVQMRRAAVPAMAHVLDELGVSARYVIFGHVHRRGPVGDERWRAPGFFNTGSWLYEPMLIDRSTPPHPYWPGGAVLLEPGCPPRSIGLLDGLDHDQLVGISEVGRG